MLSPVYLNAFKKDVKLAKKRGLDSEALKLVLTLIVKEEPLPDKFRSHKLSGNWNGHWECHISPDWLLIYRISKGDAIFERTGSHADMFGSLFGWCVGSCRNAASRHRQTPTNYAWAGNCISGVASQKK